VSEELINLTGIRGANSSRSVPHVKMISTTLQHAPQKGDR